MRALAIAFAVGLLLAPLAAARVALEPSQLALVEGGSARVQVVVVNEERIRLAADLRVGANGGLEISLSRARVDLAPGERTSISTTVRAPEGTAGLRKAEILLYERGEPVAIARATLTAQVEAAPEPRPEDGGPAFPLAGAALAGLALLGAIAWRRWGIAAVLLYARMRRERVADHPTRAALLAEVAREPGLPLAELQRRVGLANGPFEHHLRKLEAFRYVHLVEDGRYRRVYPPGAGATPTPPTAERMLELVHREGEASLAAIARELGLSRQTLHRHARRLAEEGRVVPRLRGGRLVLLRADLAPR